MAPAFEPSPKKVLWKRPGRSPSHLPLSQNRSRSTAVFIIRLRECPIILFGAACYWHNLDGAFVTSASNPDAGRNANIFIFPAFGELGRWFFFHFVIIEDVIVVLEVMISLMVIMLIFIIIFITINIIFFYFLNISTSFLLNYYLTFSSYPQNLIFFQVYNKNLIIPILSPALTRMRY